jgi:hypothetical protein
LSPDRARHLYNLRRHTFPASNFRQQAHCQQKIFAKNLNRFESTINEMKPPKRQRKQSAKSQMTQRSGTKRQKTSNRQQRQETDSYNVPPVVPRNNTRTVIDIQTHNDDNHRQNDTSMNALTPSTSGWPGRNPSHTQTMHDARTHGHTSAERSSETLRHAQVSGTETRSVEPAQNTAVSQPIMQNDVSMAPISTRVQSTHSIKY